MYETLGETTQPIREDEGESVKNHEVVVGAKFVNPDGTTIDEFPDMRAGIGFSIMWVKIGDVYLDNAAITEVRWEGAFAPHKVTIELTCGPFKTVDYRDPVYKPGGLTDERSGAEDA